MNTERSDALFLQARQRIPGGVNSPVRAFRSVGRNPLFMQRAAGAYLWDVDGNRYIDYIGSWGPMILGHAHPRVIEAIARAASQGTRSALRRRPKSQWRSSSRSSSRPSTSSAW